MAPRDSEVAIIPSVLDRLIDLEPRQTREASRSHAVSLREMKAAIRRDVEWLLNSRAFIDAEKLGLEEAKNSVAVFGLPDITGVGAENLDERKNLTSALEQAIRVFEPRFLNPRITMEPPTSTDRALKFRIETLLDVGSAPQPLVFHTVLQLGSAHFALRQI